MSTAIDNTEAADLVKQLHHLSADIAELQALADDIKGRLRATLDVGTYTVEGNDIIRLAPNRRFDVDAAIALVPAEFRENCATRGWDPKKVKEYLAPALVETCMVEAGQPRVSLI